MALDARDISFRHGPRFALEGVSLSLAEGRFTGLIGPNGSGKTTLIKILCGLIQPDSGAVLLDGRPLSEYPSYDRARRIAYVSQTWRPTFEFTVEQSVLLGRIPWQKRYGGFEEEADIEAADRALNLVGLERLRYEPVTNLSGGELQRVMIAAALAQEAGILILDEPTTHLDVAHQQRVLETVRLVMKERGLTVLASIHDLNLASMYSDEIAVLHSGRLTAQGSPATVLNEEMFAEVFGLDLEVSPERYGAAPAVQYRMGRGYAAHGE